MTLVQKNMGLFKAICLCLVFLQLTPAEVQKYVRFHLKTESKPRFGRLVNPEKVMSAERDEFKIAEVAMPVVLTDPLIIFLHKN